VSQPEVGRKIGLLNIWSLLIMIKASLPVYDFSLEFNFLEAICELALQAVALWGNEEPVPSDNSQSRWPRRFLEIF
jgi:hypothetical protein